MRLTTLLRRLLGVTQMYVKQVEMAADGPLTVSVEPSWRRSRCGTCGKRAPRYDRQPVRQWRHLSWGRMPAWLRYAPWRVSCRRCRGVKVEQVPWASGSAPLTSGGSPGGDGARARGSSLGVRGAMARRPRPPAARRRGTGAARGRPGRAARAGAERAWGGWSSQTSAPVAGESDGPSPRPRDRLGCLTTSGPP